MYLGRPPSTSLTQQRGFGADWNWEWSKKGDDAAWFVSKPGQSTRIPFRMPLGAFYSVRRRVVMFALLDCGFPLLLVIVAIGAALWDQS